MLDTSIRQRLVHRYHWVLAQAFTRWVNHRDKVILQAQRQENTEWEGENAGVTTQIAKETNVIGEQRLWQKAQAAKLLKQLVMEAFERHLREKFKAWRDNVAHRTREVETAARLVEKLERRTRRLAFRVLTEKVELVRAEAKELQRGDEARVKLREILVTRTFRRIASHTRRSVLARQRLMGCIRRLDTGMKDEVFRQWQRFNQFRREQHLLSVQHAHVDHI